VNYVDDASPRALGAPWSPGSRRCARGRAGDDRTAREWRNHHERRSHRVNRLDHWLSGPTRCSPDVCATSVVRIARAEPCRRREPSFCARLQEHRFIGVPIAGLPHGGGSQCVRTQGGEHPTCARQPWVDCEGAPCPTPNRSKGFIAPPDHRRPAQWRVLRHVCIIAGPSASHEPVRPSSLEVGPWPRAGNQRAGRVRNGFCRSVVCWCCDTLLTASSAVSLRRVTIRKADSGMAPGRKRSGATSGASSLRPKKEPSPRRLTTRWLGPTVGPGESLGGP
jgi:hypothetical protein